MREIVVANQKGGCAKTTTVVNLAAALAETGQRVLVIDLDPQGNATNWLGADGPLDGSYRLFEGVDSISNLWGTSVVQDVWVISASQNLAHIERILAGKISVETILKRRLETLNVKDWDFVLIDTPPTLGLLTLNALAYAGELLIPVTTHVLTLSGVAQLMQTIKSVKELLNPDLKIVGLLPSRVDTRTRHSQEILELLEEEFGSLVMKSRIKESVRVAESPSFNETILTYDKNSSGARDYRHLATELLERK